MTLNDDHDLYLLSRCMRFFSGCDTPPSLDAELLSMAFRAVISHLDDIGVWPVVVGPIAIARYCKAQYTELIGVRILRRAATPMALDQLSENLRSKLPAKSPVRWHISPIYDPVERLLAARSTVVEWLGTPARLATAEHLLWLALSSEELQSEVDAVDIIQSGHVDLHEFQSLCRNSSPQLLRPLFRAWRSARRTEHSTYSKSVEFRLAIRARQKAMQEYERREARAAEAKAHRTVSNSRVKKGEPSD